MSRLAIIGASGALGERLVTRALARGYRVNALVRDPARLRRHAEEHTAFRFDAESGEGLEAGIAGCQFVVCAVGGLKPIVTACVTATVKALGGKKQLQRLVLVSRLGASESRPQSTLASGPLQGFLPVLLAPVFKDLAQAEGLVRMSKFPYSIFRATRLTDEPGGAPVVAVPSTEPPPHRISRVDLALFIIDSLERPEWADCEATVGALER